MDNIDAAIYDFHQSFLSNTGVVQLMDIGDVQRKDIVDHPENYTLLTTLDEGQFHDATPLILLTYLFERKKNFVTNLRKFNLIF